MWQALYCTQTDLSHVESSEQTTGSASAVSQQACVDLDMLMSLCTPPELISLLQQASHEGSEGFEGSSKEVQEAEPAAEAVWKPVYMFA